MNNLLTTTTMLALSHHQTPTSSPLSDKSTPQHQYTSSAPSLASSPPTSSEAERVEKGKVKGKGRLGVSSLSLARGKGKNVEKLSSKIDLVIEPLLEGGSLDESEDVEKSWCCDEVMEALWDVAVKAGEAWEKQNLRSKEPASSPIAKVAESVTSKSDSVIHTKAPPFSTPKPGREHVLKIFFHTPANTRTSDAFIKRMSWQNTERKWRATYAGDPYEEPAIPTHRDPQEKLVELPVSEVLDRMLPSPSVFTADTYLSKRHKMSSIENGHVDPEMRYADASLQARVKQYAESKALLESVMAKGKFSRKGPAPPTELGACGAVGDQEWWAAEVKLACERSLSGEDDLPTQEHMQFVLLRNWELKRDLERLEPLHSSLKEAKKRMKEQPWTASSSIIRSIPGREMPYQDENASDQAENSLPEATTHVPVTTLPPPDTEEYEENPFSSNFDAYRLDGTAAKTSTDISSQRQPFRYDQDAPWPQYIYTPMTTPVDDNCEYLAGRLTPVQAAEGQLKLAEAQESLRRHQALYHKSSCSTEIGRPSMALTDEGERRDELGSAVSSPWKKFTWRSRRRRV